MARYDIKLGTIVHATRMSGTKVMVLGPLRMGLYMGLVLDTAGSRPRVRQLFVSPSTVCSDAEA